MIHTKTRSITIYFGLSGHSTDGSYAFPYDSCGSYACCNASYYLCLCCRGLHRLLCDDASNHCCYHCKKWNCLCSCCHCQHRLLCGSCANVSHFPETFHKESGRHSHSVQWLRLQTNIPVLVIKLHGLTFYTRDKDFYADSYPRDSSA